MKDSEHLESSGEGEAVVNESHKPGNENDPHSESDIDSEVLTTLLGRRPATAATTTASRKATEEQNYEEEARPNVQARSRRPVQSARPAHESQNYSDY